MNKKVKVLYIVSTLKRGGPTNVLFNLISEIDRDKIEPIILTLSSESINSTSLLEDFIKLKIKVISLSLSRIKGFLFVRKRLKHIIYSENIKLLHLFGYRPDYFVNVRDYKGIKIVSTINSNIFDDYTMLYGNLFGRIIAYSHIKTLFGKEIIACSKFVADELNQRYGIRLKIIYNGVSKNIYCKTNQNERFQLRNKLDLPIDKNIFIFVGLLIQRKNPITVIKAFLKSNVSNNSVLLILGDGPLMDECKSICLDHTSNIIFLGNQPTTLEYLKAADFYVSSSFSEGLPTSVMEAMGCGLPVILSDIKPHNELVVKLADYNYLFPITDFNKLAIKMDAIVKSDYYFLSLNCSKIISESINSEIMARKYEHLYGI